MINNIFKEESNTVEYKKTLPNESNKWLKSIVSFSNTAGGELFIGIEDSTMKVFGITENRSVFEQKIIETIYHNIDPRPIVDIVFKNIEDKDIAIIQISKGNEQPYFIKNQGVEDGCYIRYGSTDQKATNSQRTELMYNRKNESYSNKMFDEQGRLLKITEVNVKDFLIDTNKRVKTGKEISITKLLEWNLLKKSFDETYVTNGLMLLSENRFSHSHIRIGYFSGLTKTKLLDEVKITGSIISQYDEVMSILLKKLKTDYMFSIIREQQYQVPEVALREVVANAIVHRNYLEKEPIRISLFDDQIEVFSPGTFFDGLQLSDVLNGISKLRNPNICEIFYHVGIIEKWGSGIIRANEALEKESMQPLIFEVNSIHGVNVVIKYDKSDIKRVQNKTLDEENYLVQKSRFTRKDLENNLNMTQDQARYLIEKWLDKGMVTKHGGGRNSSYKVNH
ncbi:MAG: putative DNA binding domain-containing protein [Acholeplasma sp.]|nr:putative DNA binding domain-containing protein [Acholeplasma sp.]